MFFDKWLEKVKLDEKDLLLTRFVLMKVLINKTGHAYKIYSEFANNSYLKNSLLKEFLYYLFESLKLRDKEIFV